MLTRERLINGAYLNAFKDLPGQPRWSHERIETSMHAALQQRPSGQPVWLFAYGSLIWNPLIEIAESQAAVLPGWHRSFCMQLLTGRGSLERPGRMLALRAGGQCQGRALRLHEAGLLHELLLVWIREMPYGNYRPIWQSVHLANGKQVQALVFVADPGHACFADDACLHVTAAAIATAAGHLGSNLEYLQHLHTTLQAHDIVDEHVQALMGTLDDLNTGAHMKTLVFFEFSYAGPWHDNMFAAMKELAQDIATEEGLIWKIWTEAPERQTAGGVYLFSNQATAQAYIDKHSARLASFGISDIDARSFQVNEDLSRIDHGDKPVLSAA